MRSTVGFRVLCLSAMAALAMESIASADNLITQWNFNNTGTGNNSIAAGSSGLVTGTLALARNFATMNPVANPFATVINTGVSIDPGTVVTNTSAPIGTYTYNRSLNASVPNLAAANKSVGAAFTVSTLGTGSAGQVKLSWSQTVGFRGSRYYQVLTSTSGTGGPFLPVTGGLGSSVSQLVSGYNSGSNAISGTASVTVSSAGIIDFRTIDQNWLGLSISSTGANVYTPFAPSSFAAGFVDNISYTLPTGQGYENNPNFAFAIVAVWDPSGTATSGTTGLLSSFAGTDSTNNVTGYTNASASGAGLRLDLVTVTAVPEPSTIVLAVVGVAAAGYTTVRRRRRSLDVAGR
jgi:hypothetical protein